jgi:hypothetical protein
MTTLTQIQLSRWLSVVPADRYEIPVDLPGRLASMFPICRTDSVVSLLTMTKLLQVRNAEEFNVIGHPTNPHYVFISDLDGVILCRMITAIYRPAVIVESCPEEFQGF